MIYCTCRKFYFILMQNRLTERHPIGRLFLLCCVHFFFERGHNVDTPSKKDVSASLQKRPFSLYQMRKTPILLRICQPLLLLLRIQQLLRLHQPSGCCPLQRCNFMYFPVTLKAYENQRISAVFPVFLLYYIFF